MQIPNEGSSDEDDVEESMDAEKTSNSETAATEMEAATDVHTVTDLEDDFATQSQVSHVPNLAAPPQRTQNPQKQVRQTPTEQGSARLCVKKKKAKTIQDERLDEAFRILSNASAKAEQVQNECQIFGNLVASKLQKYSPAVQTAVQQDVMSILFKADMGHYSKSTSAYFVPSQPNQSSHIISQTVPSHTQSRPCSSSHSSEYCLVPTPSPTESIQSNTSCIGQSSSNLPLHDFLSSQVSSNDNYSQYSIVDPLSRPSIYTLPEPEQGLTDL